MPGQRDPKKALRLDRAMEHRQRRLAVTSLKELRELIDLTLQGMERSDGLHDAADVDDLKACWRRVQADCQNHATAYARIAVSA